MILTLGAAADGAAAAAAKQALELMSIVEKDIGTRMHCRQIFACCTLLVIMIVDRDRMCAASAFDP